MVAWCLAALEASERIRSAVIAAPPGHEDGARGDRRTRSLGLPVDGCDRRREPLAVGGERARRAGGGRTSSWSTTPPGRWSTPELFDRCVERARALGLRRRGRGGARGRHDQGGGRRRPRDRDARARERCGRCRPRRSSEPRPCAEALDAGDLDAGLPTTRSSSRRRAATCAIVEAPRHNLKVTNAHRPPNRRAAARRRRARDADRLPHPPAAGRSRHRRRAITSPSATWRGISRRRRERGIAELGFSEHVYRFREALDVWRHPFWEESAVDDLDAYVEFLLEMETAGYPVKLGSRWTTCPGREERDRRAARGPAVRLRDRLGALHRRPRGRPRGLRRLAQRRPRRGLERVLRGARRGGGQRALRRAGAPRPGEGLGRRAAGPAPSPRATFYELAIERDRGRGRGDRGLDRRAAKARRRDLPVARAARDVRRGRASRSRCPRTRTCRSTSATGTTARSQLLRDAGVERDRVFERRDATRRSRSDERPSASASATTRTASSAVRTLVLGGVEIPGEPGLARPLGRRRARARGHRRRARCGRRSATSAATSRTTDPRYEDADSIELLREVVARAGAERAGGS